jgi:hypothetical protein
MGSVYVSDNGGNRIFKYLPTDTIIVLAGSGNSSTVDGTGLSASFYHPMGIAVDALGSVYVAEYGNHCIRKIDSNAVVTTLAGTVSNSGFQDGKANAALFKNPSDIACDKNGKLYVTDYMNNRIRCIQPVKYAINPALPKGLQFDNQTGTISGTPSQTQDTTLYTVTAENTAGTCNTMLLITVASSLSGLTHQTGNDCAFYPNPVQNQIGIRGVTGTERLSIHSLTGVLLMTKEVSAGSTVDVSDLDPGVYLLRLAGREYKLVKK